MYTTGNALISLNLVEAASASQPNCFAVNPGAIGWDPDNPDRLWWLLPNGTSLQPRTAVFDAQRGTLIIKTDAADYLVNAVERRQDALSCQLTLALAEVSHGEADDIAMLARGHYYANLNDTPASSIQETETTPGFLWKPLCDRPFQDAGRLLQCVLQRSKATQVPLHVHAS